MAIFGHLYLPIKILKPASQILHIHTCVFLCTHVHTHMHTYEITTNKNNVKSPHVELLIEIALAKISVMRIDIWVF